MTVLLAADAVLADGACGPGWLAIDGGRVVDRGLGGPPRGAVSLGDRLLAPGYVDLQVNGHGSIDVARADGAEWDDLAGRLLRAGVTSYLPTLCTAPRHRYAPALERIVRARTRAAAPRIEGVHLEGPFLGGAPGAHPSALIGPVDLGWLDRLLEAHPGLIRLVTLAPEADAGHRGTRRLVAEGITVALGHSTCSFADAVEAAGAGASLVTHLGNGMRPLHQRDPGLLGAGLHHPGLVPTVIADGVHLDDAFLGIVLAHRPDAILVSDAVASGADVVHDDGVRLADGTLAGSVLTLDAAVRRAVAVGVPAASAIAMASVHPARAVGLDTWGACGVGGLADLVALEPGTLRPTAVWVGGQRVWGGGPP